MRVCREGSFVGSWSLPALRLAEATPALRFYFFLCPRFRPALCTCLSVQHRATDRGEVGFGISDHSVLRQTIFSPLSAFRHVFPRCGLACVWRRCAVFLFWRSLGNPRFFFHGFILLLSSFLVLLPFPLRVFAPDAPA